MNSPPRVKKRTPSMPKTQSHETGWRRSDVFKDQNGEKKWVKLKANLGTKDVPGEIILFAR